MTDRRDVVIGTPSTFGAADWWRSGWWPLTTAGDARDVQADVGTLGDLAVAAVISRGHKHRLEGSACDDAFHVRGGRVGRSEVVVAAVCDGLGSARSSRLGAQRLSRTVTREILSGLGRAEVDSTPENVLGPAIQRAIEDVTAWASSSGHALADLETTLTVAVVPVRPAQVSPSLIAWIGDSPAFLGRDRTWHALTGFSADEAVASSATRGALSARPEELEIRTLPIRPGERLMICSDGIGAFIGVADRPLALGTHLAEALAMPRHLDEVVRQATFDLRSADDDRTMAVIWKAPLDADAAPQ